MSTDEVLKALQAALAAEHAAIYGYGVVGARVGVACGPGGGGGGGVHRCAA
ncbi:DUF4439 domain-containing protein, partial [Streptomyces sp. NPDC051098]|uniref:DUF4439 domain-containing protein n=1 Tax=Streptomyces sp. NPDC051098 TaxID=3155411 RepID=UPI0034275632